MGYFPCYLKYEWDISVQWGYATILTFHRGPTNSHSFHEYNLTRNVIGAWHIGHVGRVEPQFLYVFQQTKNQDIRVQRSKYQQLIIIDLRKMILIKATKLGRLL